MLGCRSSTVIHSSSHRCAHCGGLTKFKPVKSLSQYQTLRRFMHSKMCTTSCYLTTQTRNTLQGSKVKDSIKQFTVQLAKVVSEQKGKMKERSPVQYDSVQFIKLYKKKITLLWDFTVIQQNKSQKNGSIQNQGLVLFSLHTPQSVVKRGNPSKKRVIGGFYQLHLP